MLLPCCSSSLQALPHQVARLRVQAGGGLVQHEQARVVHQRTRQRQAPLHAAREFARFGLRLVRECGEFEQLRNARAHLGRGQPEVAAVHQQVLGAVEVGVQRVHLAHHAELRLDGQRVARHVQAKGGDGAGVGCGQAQAHADGGGLAGAVGPDHAQALTGLDGKTQVVHHRGLAVAFDEVVAFKQGWRHGAGLCPVRVWPRGAAPTMRGCPSGSCLLSPTHPCPSPFPCNTCFRNARSPNLAAGWPTAAGVPSRSGSSAASSASTA